MMKTRRILTLLLTVLVLMSTVPFSLSVSAYCETAGLTMTDDSILTHDNISLKFNVTGYSSAQSGYVTIYPKAGYEACVAADCNGELKADGKAQYIDYYNVNTTADNKIATFPTARLSADFIVGATYVAVLNENDHILTNTAIEFTVLDTPLTLTMNADSVLTHDDLALGFTVNGYKSSTAGYVSIYTKSGYEACVAADCNGEYKVDGKVQYIDYYNLGTTASGKVAAFPSVHQTADYAVGATFVAVLVEGAAMHPETAVEFTVQDTPLTLTLNADSVLTHDDIALNFTVNGYKSAQAGYVTIYPKAGYEACVAAGCNGELKIDGKVQYIDYYNIGTTASGKVASFPTARLSADFVVGATYVAVVNENDRMLTDTALEFTVLAEPLTLTLNEDSVLTHDDLALSFTVNGYKSTQYGYVSIYTKTGYEACVAAGCNGEYKVDGKVQYIDYYNVGTTASNKVASFPSTHKTADYAAGETFVAVVVEGEKMIPATAIEFTVKAGSTAGVSLVLNDSSFLVHDGLSLSFTVNAYSSTKYGYVMIYPKAGYEACVAADCNGEYKIDGKVQYIDYYNVGTSANGKTVSMPSSHKTADYAVGTTFVAVLMEGETLLPETALEFTVLESEPLKFSIDKTEFYEGDVSFNVTVDSSVTGGWVGIYTEDGYNACVADNYNGNLAFLDWRPISELPAAMPTGWSGRNVDRIVPVFTPGTYYAALARNDNSLIKDQYITFTVKEKKEALGIDALNYAGVTDANRADSFYTDGVQIRLPNVESGTVQGLRFVASIGKNVLSAFASLDEANVKPDDSSETGIGYGYVAIADSRLDGNELTKETAGSAIVPAVNTFKETEDALIYTVCFTDIDNAHWKNDITVRPYVTFKNENGKEMTVYGDAYTTNVYDAVEYGIANDTENAAALTALMDEYVRAMQ